MKSLKKCWNRCVFASGAVIVASASILISGVLELRQSEVIASEVEILQTPEEKAASEGIQKIISDAFLDVDSDTAVVAYVPGANPKKIFVPDGRSMEIKPQPTELTEYQRILGQNVAPTIVFSARSIPYVAANIDAAIRVDGKPYRLTYDPNLSRRSQRRSAACNKASMTALLAVLNAAQHKGTQWNCDEYPFASTYEGGGSASIATVPVRENSSQGGILAGFYVNQLNQRDRAPFYVAISF